MHANLRKKQLCWLRWTWFKDGLYRLIFFPQSNVIGKNRWVCSAVIPEIRKGMILPNIFMIKENI
jgi:hypothetical protein